jgi:hypothetical protein
MDTAFTFPQIVSSQAILEVLVSHQVNYNVYNSTQTSRL